VTLAKVAKKGAWDKELAAYIALGQLPTDSEKQRSDIKQKIKDQLQIIQDNYCAYCGIHFEIVGISEREHIANKAKYPQFTFLRDNLVLACRFCNGPIKKGSKNTILTLNKSYQNCDFTIIHPYLDDFHDHIEFSLQGSLMFFSAKLGSSKGVETIKMFKLMNSRQAQLRGNAVIAKQHEQGILAPYDALRKSILSRDYFA
jgi:uncharacterized protein (TIGR02646 family)